MSKTLTLVLGIIIILVIIGLVVWRVNLNKTKNIGYTTSDWQTYQGDNFSFKYPIDWEIKSTEYHKTPAGFEATVPTIILAKVGDTSIDNTNKININLWQASCQAVTNAPKKTETLANTKADFYGNCGEATIKGLDKNGQPADYLFFSVYSDPTIKDIFKSVIDSFKEVNVS